MCIRRILYTCGLIAYVCGRQETLLYFFLAELTEVVKEDKQKHGAES